MKNMLWRSAIAVWAMALVGCMVPGIAQADIVQFGDVRFTFSQTMTLFAIGLAWGDMRQWRVGVDRRLKELEQKED